MVIKIMYEGYIRTPYSTEFSNYAIIHGQISSEQSELVFVILT